MNIAFPFQIITDQFPGDFVWPLTISAIELCTAVIAACAPTYRPLFNFLVNGDPKRNTKANSSHGISAKASGSSFSSPQIPLSDVPNVKTDINQCLSPWPGNAGYTNLDSASHKKINQ